MSKRSADLVYCACKDMQFIRSDILKFIRDQRIDEGKHFYVSAVSEENNRIIVHLKEEKKFLKSHKSKRKRRMKPKIPYHYTVIKCISEFETINMKEEVEKTKRQLMFWFGIKYGVEPVHPFIQSQAENETLVVLQAKLIK